MIIIIVVVMVIIMIIMIMIMIMIMMFIIIILIIIINIIININIVIGSNWISGNTCLNTIFVVEKKKLICAQTRHTSLVHVCTKTFYWQSHATHENSLLTPIYVWRHLLKKGHSQYQRHVL